MIESAAIGVFVFVALIVSGWRALAIVDSAKAAAETPARPQIDHYNGPRFNRHGRRLVG